jgi:magnesium chelatase subunit H
MDSHLSGAAARAQKLLKRDFPGLELSIHAADEWGTDDAALARCHADIARGDIVIATMLFLDDHVRAVMPPGGTIATPWSAACRLAKS